MKESTKQKIIMVSEVLFGILFLEAVLWFVSLYASWKWICIYGAMSVVAVWKWDKETESEDSESDEVYKVRQKD